MTYKPGRNCLTCSSYMGGKRCREGLEYMKKPDGSCEGWTPRQKFMFYDMAEQYVKDIGHTGDYHIHKKMGHYVLTLDVGGNDGQDV